jgi:hypothetical protein
MSPTALPDPTGLAAILGAVANGNMFRDMSGLAGTQAAGQAASAGTLGAATEAGRIASDNFRIASEQATEMAKAAVDLWKVSSGGKDGNQPSISVSAEGARINHGRDMDERGIKRPAAGGAGSLANGAAANGNGSGPPGSVPNELARADAGAGVSPTLFEETVRAAFPGAEMTPADFHAGRMPTVFATIADAIRREIEMIDQVEDDAAAFGLNLEGAKIIPMSRHANAADFGSVPYLAWTNSATEIYFDFEDDPQRDDFVAALIENAPSGASVDVRDVSRRLLRSIAMSTIRHEIDHVKQFKSSGRPKTFREMVQHEVVAYGSDASWWSDPGTRALLVAHLALPDWTLDGANGLVAIMQGSKSDAKTELEAILSGTNDIKEELKKIKAIPNSIQQNTNYTVDSMYKSD